MGTMQPILTAVGTAMATQALTQTNNAVSLNQLDETQALEEAQLDANAALQKEQIALENAQAEEDRKDALKRAVASQKASFGAQGVGSNGGSSQAVLLGFVEESEEEKAQREALNALKTKAIDEDVAQEKAINTLQREQLAERNQVGGVTGFLGDLF